MGPRPALPKEVAAYNASLSSQASPVIGKPEQTGVLWTDAKLIIQTVGAVLTAQSS